MFGLTPDEKRVIIFFLLALGLGNAVLLYKKTHPAFAPNLKYGSLDLAKPGEIKSVPEDTLGTEIVFANKEARSRKALLTGKININSAGQSDLERLPSIGPVMAKKIINYRSASGGFRQVEDLMKVQGIGNKKFNKLRDHVFVDP